MKLFLEPSYFDMVVLSPPAELFLAELGCGIKKIYLCVATSEKLRWTYYKCVSLPQQPGTRVALDMTTLTIMRYLPREVDPLVYNMSHEDPGDVTYNKIGGLAEQIRELREVSA